MCQFMIHRFYKDLCIWLSGPSLRRFVTGGSRDSRARSGALVASSVGLVLIVVSFVWQTNRTMAASANEMAPLRTVRSVVDYRTSGSHPYWEHSVSPDRRRRWTPEEIIELLKKYPDYYLDRGIRTGVPTGGLPHREMGRIVNEVQALGRSQGVDTSHLMVHFRSDVFAKRPKGFGDCTICNRAGKCSDLCTWEGSMQNAPFDPGWIVTIPRAEHQWSVDRIWGGDPSKDPWSRPGARLWPAWIDRKSIAAVNTTTHVAAVYGAVKDRNKSVMGMDHAVEVSGVLLDLSKPEYRAWSIKKLIADLQVMGIDPGEKAALVYTYKPGWHVYYAGPDSGDRCYVEDSHMWTGPANPCSGIHPPGGPFARTPYGPGEFEQAVNSMLREIRAAFVDAGFAGVVLMTVERPSFTKEKWSILEPDVRGAPWLVGELISSCDRTNLSLPANPLTCR